MTSKNAVKSKNPVKSRKKLLVLCTGNSARSQMAEGLLRHEGGDRFEVHSAGTEPSRVRAEAIAVMAEIGIDISGHRSKSVDEFLGQNFDFAITVCNHAREACPIFPGPVFSGTAKRLHWPFDDPAPVQGSNEVRQAAFRTIRNQIHSRIMVFLNGEESLV